jgi:hypothetical protein
MPNKNAGMRNGCAPIRIKKNVRYARPNSVSVKKTESSVRNSSVNVSKSKPTSDGNRRRRGRSTRKRKTGRRRRRMNGTRERPNASSARLKNVARRNSVCGLKNSARTGNVRQRRRRQHARRMRNYAGNNKKRPK